MAISAESTACFSVIFPVIFAIFNTAVNQIMTSQRFVSRQSGDQVTVKKKILQVHIYVYEISLGKVQKWFDAANLLIHSGN